MKKSEIPTFVVNLALEKGATDVVAELEDQQRVMIRFSNNEITVSKFYQETLLSVFLMIKKHRTATVLPVSSTRNLKKAVETLVKTAKVTPPADIYVPLPKGPFQYNPTLQSAPKTSLSPNKLIGYVKDGVDGALREGAKKVAGTLIASKSKSTLCTSGQVYATQEGGGLELSIRAFVSDVASGHSVSISRNEEGFNPAEAGESAGRIAKAAANPTQGQPGRFTALLGPLIFADLVNQIGTRASAFMVDAGRSFLTGKIGQEVACDKFTLVDDPTVADAFSVRAFDDEGVPTRRNIIIDRGVLKTYLHNSTTAKKFGAETTANAGLIAPRPWNLIVQPGEKSFEQLLGEIDNGIYVTNDWYLRYQNYRTGDFSTIPRDGMFLIKNGQISASIRELRISDNMLRIMRNIRDLSRSRSWIRWWEVSIPTLTPYAVIEDLNFTKSGM